MTDYIIRRLLLLFPVMIIVATFVFLLIHLAPGDPTAYLLGEDAPEDLREAMRERMGLDRPIHIQYFTWLGRLIQGDLGRSISLRQSVSEAIFQRLEPTFILAIMSLLIAVSIGIPSGVISALKQDGFLDHFFMTLAMFGLCIPNFWLALMLVLLFGVQLRWIPLIGYPSLADSALATIQYLLIPAFVLGFSGRSAAIARLTRANVLDVLGTDYIRTARSKGLSEQRVIYVHALRNAMLPTLTVIGVSLAGLMSGAVVIENIFAIPGLGQLLVSSIYRRDYPVIQGTVIFVAIIYVLANLVVDILYVFVDPRIRYD